MGKKCDEEVANELDFDLERQIGREYTVRGMFQDEQLFEKFIAWMIREFSGENILSFVEFVQFKQYVIKIKEEQTAAAVIECESRTDTGTATAATEEEEDVNYINYCYDQVPISSIVSREKIGLNEIEKCRDIAHELWLKYIKVEAIFEINIAYDLRRKYKNCDDNNWNMSLNELLIIFDDAMLEARRFMQRSLVRLKADMRNKITRSPTIVSPASGSIVNVMKI